MSGAFETVYRSSNLVTAEVICAALNSNDIEAVLDNEHQGGYTGVLDVKVLVKRENAEAAKAFIREHEAPNVEPGDS